MVLMAGGDPLSSFWELLILFPPQLFGVWVLLGFGDLLLYPLRHATLISTTYKSHEIEHTISLVKRWNYCYFGARRDDVEDGENLPGNQQPNDTPGFSTKPLWGPVPK